jgi:prophage antirepressor-like protein
MSNTQLETFMFQSHPLRVIQDEQGEPWFIAKDICDILEYGNAARTINDLCRQEGIRIAYIPILSNNYKLINEGNLYRLVIKSTKPEARLFEDWVCDEVLPTLRKTGSYGLPEFLKPITEDIPIEDFEWRYQAISQALKNLKNAKVTITFTGAELLAGKCFE